jgi:uncharacterized protein YndB with AHSA1/START domain
MPVTNVEKDPQRLTMAITAEYEAPAERVWQLWDDPRQLERWWGPPGYPATFAEHDLTPGATTRYYMTSPEGERYHGWWRIVTVDGPRYLELEDGFADGDGQPNPEMPTSILRVTIGDGSGVTRMAIETTFASLEAMEQVLAMGAEEGMLAAMGQIEDLLASGVTPR